MTAAGPFETASPPQSQDGTAIKFRDIALEEEQFHRFIIGQDHAVKEFAKLLVKIRSGLRFANLGPVDVKFLAGPSGVGKTEMVYVLAAALLETMGDIGDSEAKNTAHKKVLKINGAEYQLEHEVAKLLGAPPGYVGYQASDTASVILSPAVINQYKIKYKDFQDKEQEALIILIDEAEKAHHSLHRAFLSPIEKGQMRLGNNTEVDFSNAVIFFTSNVGTQEAEQAQKRTIGLVKPNSAKTSKRIIEESFRKIFPPEFRGRIKDLIIFDSLNKEMAEGIARLKLRNAETSLLRSGLNIRLQVTDTAFRYIVQKGIGHSEGARFLEKFIEREIWDPLAIFSNPKDLNGSIVTVDQLGSNGLILAKTKIEADAWLIKLREDSRLFYLNHGLTEMAEELEGEIVLNDGLTQKVQKHINNGFLNGIILPRIEVQQEQGIKIFQAMVNKPSPTLKGENQYTVCKNDTFQRNFERCLNVKLNRLPGAYLVLYRYFMDPETVGVKASDLIDKFNKNSWQSFSVIEYLLAQRMEAEKRGDHTFDQWAAETSKSDVGSGWLLNYSFNKESVRELAYADWSSIMNTVRIMIAPNNVFSNIGAHPIILVPISIAKAIKGA